MATGNKPKIKKITQHLFPKSAVKTANERLRKLETVNRLATSSEAYKSIEKYANDPNSLSHKFYREVTNKDGSPGIRFLTPSEYKKLTEYEKRQFDETVQSFLENKTTTKLGIEKVRRDNYDHFMENHPELSWTQDEYEGFFSTYGQMKKDREDVVAYGILTQILNARTEFSNDLTEDKIQTLVHYNASDIRYGNRPSRGTLTNNRYLRGTDNRRK